MTSEQAFWRHLITHHLISNVTTSTREPGLVPPCENPWLLREYGSAHRYVRSGWRNLFWKFKNLSRIITHGSQDYGSWLSSKCLHKAPVLWHPRSPGAVSGCGEKSKRERKKIRTKKSQDARLDFSPPPLTPTGFPRMLTALWHNPCPRACLRDTQDVTHAETSLFTHVT